MNEFPSWEQEYHVVCAAFNKAQDKLRDAKAEIERLQARLPKTADGLPVVPGQVVYHRDWRGTVTEAFGEWQSPFPNLLQCCYSTREAAEAARTEVTE